ncbi:MAG: hypothetical protein H6573_18895 [Lewinellaceae bacterium]|nr:hypothetical protein [Phaeodactylibacter sp.]MCB9349560.1 hypothetical protein [Lewinellaceae bacterium]
MSKKKHRGRIQAQSDHLEESVSWAQDSPPSLKQGLEMAEELKGKLSKKELKNREKQFKQLERFMKNASEAGGIYSPEFRSFENEETNDGTRVDFELWAGAFGLSVVIIILIIFLA